MEMVKQRIESPLLRCLRILNRRMGLSEEEQKYLFTLEKGFEGEVMFDELLMKMKCNGLILGDLLLEVNKTTFQIDTLVIQQNTLYLFEVKNLEGDYCYTPESFETPSGKEYKNPINQLTRSKSLFRQLLQNLNCQYTVESYIPFVNPEFTLYQVPQNLPFILPTQLNRFLKRLDSKPCTLNGAHRKLSDKFISLHMIDSPYSRLPHYTIDGLRKGIVCKYCASFFLNVEGWSVICGNCKQKEGVEEAVMRSVEEFKLLFPNERITTITIHEWCNIINCKKRVRRILQKNFKEIGHGQWTYYEVRQHSPSSLMIQGTY